MIAAVVVTHAAPHDVLSECLGSLAAAGGVECVIVVANGPDAPIGVADGVEVVHVANDGYGAAANVGFRRALAAGADAVALLNDDVTVRPGWLDPLVAELGGDVGAAQPLLVTAGSDPPVVNSAGVAIDRHGAGVDIADGELLAAGRSAGDLERFTAGAVLLAADFLRATGGFDRRWFLYYEDADLAARGGALGWRYRFVPAAVVDHRRGVSTSVDEGRTRFFQERNRLWHAARHLDASTQIRALSLSVRRLRHRPRRVHARALLAGVSGMPGAWWRRRGHRDALRGNAHF